MAGARRVLRVGTRGSALALEQTRRVVEALRARFPDLAVETRVITTAGDTDKRTPLAVIGGHGVFVKELQAALLRGEIDLTVHSAKDLPTEAVPGLVIGAFRERDDPRDVLIARGGHRLVDLPPGACVGTSSRRRVVALRHLRPDVQAVELRGNVDTRLRKVVDGEVDAAVLAAAGVLRMGRGDRIREYLPLDVFVPAPGQAALAIECRADDTEVASLLAQLTEPATALAVETERAFLRATGGGCRSPIGAHATVDGQSVTLRAMLADEAMTQVRFQTRVASAPTAESMAIDLATEMRSSLLDAAVIPKP